MFSLDFFYSPNDEENMVRKLENGELVKGPSILRLEDRNLGERLSRERRWEFEREMSALASLRQYLDNANKGRKAIHQKSCDLETIQCTLPSITLYTRWEQIGTW
ncbi:hypothetical protein VNO77_33746 [Canavalia gladiata]|uniref:Uncharacterized protein n=1 Tax=Canavalia gladiata TaxID=3824 RepID=A0AAN9KDX3_CANGL